ncbi:uncharacterized protein LOC106471641 [Limulus polyphemus]|uniref:Uncharacterized protein LOC106471641 n=1 Tax=Limulus polyphemus TaxID=6850 RepID=A0ABM1BSB7_LIMPO|nr:uncharacterized protein LOC106471641 [Limulus polyphemus]
MFGIRLTIVLLSLILTTLASGQEYVKNYEDSVSRGAKYESVVSKLEAILTRLKSHKNSVLQNTINEDYYSKVKTLVSNTAKLLQLNREDPVALDRRTLQYNIKNHKGQLRLKQGQLFGLSTFHPVGEPRVTQTGFKTVTTAWLEWRNLEVTYLLATKLYGVYIIGEVRARIKDPVQVFIEISENRAKTSSLAVLTAYEPSKVGTISVKVPSLNFLGVSRFKMEKLIAEGIRDAIGEALQSTVRRYLKLSLKKY